jgi:hypothetical protein
MQKWDALRKEYDNHQNGGSNNGNANNDDEQYDKALNTAGDKHDNDDYEDYPDSQDAFNNCGDNEDNDDVHDMHSDYANLSHGSPKKQKVDQCNMCDFAMDWHTTDNHHTFKVHFVAISQPDISSMHDTLSFLNGFKLGFGGWFQRQNRLAHFGFFPGCISCIVGCPINLVHFLRNCVSTTLLYLNKYKVFGSLIAKESYI